MKKADRIVLDAVSQVYGMPVSTLRSVHGVRTARAVEARSVAAYVLSTRYVMSQKEIGGVIGRDHSTVGHALRKLRHRLCLVASGEGLPGDAELQDRIERVQRLVARKGKPVRVTVDAPPKPPTHEQIEAGDKLALLAMRVVSLWVCEEPARHYLPQLQQAAHAWYSAGSGSDVELGAIAASEQQVEDVGGGAE